MAGVWQVQVTLAESAELEVSVGADKAYSGCICADEARTFRWGVRATSLGMGHRGHRRTPLPCCLGTPWRMGWVGRTGPNAMSLRKLSSAPLPPSLLPPTTFPIASQCCF